MYSSINCFNYRNRTVGSLVQPEIYWNFKNCKHVTDCNFLVNIVLRHSNQCIRICYYLKWNKKSETNVITNRIIVSANFSSFNDTPKSILYTKFIVLILWLTNAILYQSHNIEDLHAKYKNTINFKEIYTISKIIKHKKVTRVT